MPRDSCWSTSLTRSARHRHGNPQAQTLSSTVTFPRSGTDHAALRLAERWQHYSGVIRPWHERRLVSSARATSAASSRTSRRPSSSATSCCSTSPRRRSSPRARRSTSSRTTALSGNDAKITGTSNWDDLAGADVLIITAGIPRKPGQSRDDLVGVNLPIIRNVADNAKKYCPDAFVIVISNPLDAMVYEYKRRIGCAAREGRRHGRRARQRALLAVPGARGRRQREGRARHGARRPRRRHGARARLHAPSTASPCSSSSPTDKLAAIVERTRKGGGEIVELMGTSAYYAPASSAIAMAEAYLLRPEAPPARRRVPRRRVRLQGSVHGRAGRHRRRRRREDHRDRADAPTRRRCSRRAPTACKRSSTSSKPSPELFAMKIHEYQGKQIFQRYGIPIPKGIRCSRPPRPRRPPRS